MNSIDYCKELLQSGVVVLPTSLIDITERKIQQDKFISILESFPEFNEHAKKTNSYVLGGFSALGNPASFHNMFVRDLRFKLHIELYEILFKHILKKYPEHYLENIIDRLLFRKQGISPTKESWHRDDSSSDPDDLIFGGWINLNDEPHKFSCIKGTHTLMSEYSPKTPGFNKIPKEQHSILKEQSEVVVVPPGYFIIFFDQIIHEVLAQKRKFNIMRLFSGFRVTKSKDSLIPNLRNILEDQAVVPLKSTQIPSMYSRLHIANWIDKVEYFSKGVNEFATEDYKVKSGKNKGKLYRICPKEMCSLKEYSIKTKSDMMYPRYSENEISIHFPHILV